MHARAQHGERARRIIGEDAAPGDRKRNDGVLAPSDTVEHPRRLVVAPGSIKNPGPVDVDHLRLAYARRAARPDGLPFSQPRACERVAALRFEHRSLGEQHVQGEDRVP